MPSLRVRAWCFTLNNYSDDDVSFINAALADATKVNYGVYGFEVGPSGTPHLQGYIMFGGVKSMATVKRFLGNERVHVEVARGTPTQNREYCIKDDDSHEFGSLPSQRQVHIRVNDVLVQVSFQPVVDLTHDD